jgi:hypothetical protein
MSRIQTTVETHDLTRTSHNRIMRRIMGLVGLRHKSKRVIKHFQRVAETNPGSGGYRYQRRSERTKERKRKLGVDPLVPNVQTGEMRQLVASSGRVTRTKDKWTWRAKGTTDRPLPDWQRRELEAITAAEIDDDTRLMSRLYEQLAKLPQNRRRRRRRVG